MQAPCSRFDSDRLHHGPLAERVGAGLQNQSGGFDSRADLLTKSPSVYAGGFCGIIGGMDKLRDKKFWWDRLTKCDSGLYLNPLMHVFMFVLLVFTIAYLFFDHTETVEASVLYQQTDMVGGVAVNSWGAVGALAIVLHSLGMLIRGKWGMKMLRAAIFAGFYVWLWAAVVYLQDHFWFQFFAAGVPNLAFWTWYAWQYRRRHNNEVVAFV